MGKPWAMIIDVRNRREYEKGHVKGAVNLPYDHLLERVCLPRDKILVICCERGAASMAEGKRLAENGYEVKTGSSADACIPQDDIWWREKSCKGAATNISSCQAGKDTVR